MKTGAISSSDSIARVVRAAGYRTNHLPPSSSKQQVAWDMWLQELPVCRICSEVQFTAKIVTISFPV